MPKVALSKFHMPKFQLTKFYMPKVLYAIIPIAKIHWSHSEIPMSGIYKGKKPCLWSERSYSRQDKTRQEW